MDNLSLSDWTTIENNYINEISFLNTKIEKLQKEKEQLLKHLGTNLQNKCNEEDIKKIFLTSFDEVKKENLSLRAFIHESLSGVLKLKAYGEVNHIFNTGSSDDPINALCKQASFSSIVLQQLKSNSSKNLCESCKEQLNFLIKKGA